MRSSTAGAIAGLVSGAILSGLLTFGRDLGLITTKTLPEETRDWLDAQFGARRRFGDEGVTAIEQTGHYAASAGLGVLYARIRPRAPLPGVVVGAAFGAAIYAGAVAGVLPELGITRGERNEAPGVPTQRFVSHVLFGALIGVAFDAMIPRRRRVAPPGPPVPAAAPPAAAAAAVLASLPAH